MATKNGAAFLKEQLSSILAQLTPYDEVVVSDDCSSDSTLSVIHSLNDPRIRVLEHRSEIGITKNFETSISASKGDYIFLSDQDDIWLGGKIQKMKVALQQVDLVVCDCHVVDDKLQMKNESFYTLNKSGKGLIKNLFKNSYMGCCMAFTSRLKKRLLPFPSDIPMHDVWIGLIAELYYSVYFLPEPLVMHRRHPYNASTSGSPSRYPIDQKISNRFRMIKNLLIHKYHAS
jgi:glycosyltransferase involved in cell wall biosynthesis